MPFVSSSVSASILARKCSASRPCLHRDTAERLQTIDRNSVVATFIIEFFRIAGSMNMGIERASDRSPGRNLGRACRHPKHSVGAAKVEIRVARAERVASNRFSRPRLYTGGRPISIGSLAMISTKTSFAGRVPTFCAENERLPTVFLSTA